MDERNFFVGDRRKVELRLLVVAKIDRDRLIGQRLRKFENSWRCRTAGISGNGSLSHLKLSIHKTRSPTNNWLN